MPPVATAVNSGSHLIFSSFTHHLHNRTKIFDKINCIFLHCLKKKPCSDTSYGKSHTPQHELYNKMYMLIYGDDYVLSREVVSSRFSVYYCERPHICIDVMLYRCLSSLCP